MLGIAWAHLVVRVAHTYKHTDRLTDRQRGKQRSRRTDIHTYMHEHTWTYMNGHEYTYIPTYMHAHIHTFFAKKLTYFLAYLHTYMHTLHLYLIYKFRHIHRWARWSGTKVWSWLFSACGHGLDQGLQAHAGLWSPRPTSSICEIYLAEMFVPEIEVTKFHLCHVSIHSVSPVVHVQRQTSPSQETRRKSRAQGSRLRPTRPLCQAVCFHIAVAEHHCKDQDMLHDDKKTDWLAIYNTRKLLAWVMEWLLGYEWIGWLTAGLIDGLLFWLKDCLIGWLMGCVFDWLIDGLIDGCLTRLLWAFVRQVNVSVRP